MYLLYNRNEEMMAKNVEYRSRIGIMPQKTRWVQIRSESESDWIRSDFGTKMFISDWIGLQSPSVRLGLDLGLVYIKGASPLYRVTSVKAR